MNYRIAIKVLWRDASPYYLKMRARRVIERKCCRYRERAKRHTLSCC